MSVNAADENAAISLFSADRIAENAIKDSKKEKEMADIANNSNDSNMMNSFRGSVRNLTASVRNIFFDWGKDPEIEKLEKEANDEEKMKEIVSADHIVENVINAKQEKSDENNDGDEGFQNMKKKNSTSRDNNDTREDMRGSFARLSESVRKGWFDW